MSLNSPVTTSLPVVSKFAKHLSHGTAMSPVPELETNYPYTPEIL